eukprot:gene15023-20568_t
MHSPSPRCSPADARRYAVCGRAPADPRSGKCQHPAQRPAARTRHPPRRHTAAHPNTDRGTRIAAPPAAPRAVRGTPDASGIPR